MWCGKRYMHFCSCYVLKMCKNVLIFFLFQLYLDKFFFNFVKISTVSGFDSYKNIKLLKHQTNTHIYTTLK